MIYANRESNIVSDDGGEISLLASEWSGRIANSRSAYAEVFRVVLAFDDD